MDLVCPSVGIVIISLISLLVGNLLSSFACDHHVDVLFRYHSAVTRSLAGEPCGHSSPGDILKHMRRYERLAWIPVLIVYVVALGIGGKHLINPPAAQPATAIAILSFASTIAGFVITYSPLSSDFTIYFRPDVSR